MPPLPEIKRIDSEKQNANESVRKSATEKSISVLEAKKETGKQSSVFSFKNHIQVINRSLAISLPYFPCQKHNRI